MTGPAPQPPRGGLPYALGAHLVWGLLPLYLMLLFVVFWLYPIVC